MSILLKDGTEARIFRTDAGSLVCTHGKHGRAVTYKWDRLEEKCCIESEPEFEFSNDTITVSCKCCPSKHIETEEITETVANKVFRREFVSWSAQALLDFVTKSDDEDAYDFEAIAEHLNQRLFEANIGCVRALPNSNSIIAAIDALVKPPGGPDRPLAPVKSDTA